MVVTAGLFYFTKFEIAEMPTPKAHERKDMSIQPSVHSSTALTQSLRRMPTPKSRSTAVDQRQRRPDEVRTAELRERIRLDALKKQRNAMSH